MKPYDYSQRTGVLPLTWDDFAQLASHLAELLEPFHPEIIVGLARAGLFPATAVACSLRCELYPARLTRRLNDRVISETPVWKVPISPAVTGKVVAIVDEIADSGQTLALAATQALELGARQVITASLVSHSWADPAPQFTALVTDAFVIFPWDEKVRVNGVWVPHPEVEAGLMAQGNFGTRTTRNTAKNTKKTPPPS
jgi:hypoxanthine phosphoribosyltransferase